MKYEIEPTTKKDKYTLEDKDYLLINAIERLSEAIERLRQDG